MGGVAGSAHLAVDGGDDVGAGGGAGHAGGAQGVGGLADVLEDFCFDCSHTKSLDQGFTTLLA